ncbi:hypothetical protein [Saccharomonospora viridis]|uniref:Glutamine synthetase n=1 Tax=Saccharomonospora viridis TaxID=1852 RepID=A0A837DAW2_9PSEU|nr:hypothetical protein [Saccharomonospora viridis]KHF42936.1 glutamine synthetase [Saccharomonospora viridis]
MTAVDQKTAPSQHTTALDEHRDRNADRATLDAIRAQINEHGVEFIYYQIVTVTGRVVAKVVPARHLERNAIKGVNLHRTAMTDLQSDRHGNLLGGGQEAAEFTALPDLDTFAVLPWEPSMGPDSCARCTNRTTGLRWAVSRCPPTPAGCSSVPTPLSSRRPDWSCAPVASPR